MEYALLIAFATGLLLCFIAWMMVTIAGFRHHFVTGLIATVPVLNLLILPTIWHRAYLWFFTGIVGILLAVGAWYGGADTKTGKYAAEQGIDLKILGIHAPPSDDIVTQSLNLPSPEQNNTQVNTLPDTTKPLKSTATQRELPVNALYRMSFKETSLAQITDHISQYIRITRSDHKQLEGKLLEVNQRAIRLERNINGGILTQDIQLNEIDKLEVMRR